MEGEIHEIIYNSSFDKWARWCGERNRNPLPSPHEKVDGQPVGQHPTIVRVLKGAYNKRPPIPRYSNTWEVAKITSYIIALGDNKSLSLKLLSQKLVTLLALLEGYEICYQMVFSLIQFLYQNSLVHPGHSTHLRSHHLLLIKAMP